MRLAGPLPQLALAVAVQVLALSVWFSTFFFLFPGPLLGFLATRDLSRRWSARRV